MDISSLVHAVHMGEQIENIQVLLQNVHCEDHQWKVYADLKVTAMLTATRWMHQILLQLM